MNTSFGAFDPISFRVAMSDVTAGSHTALKDKMLRIPGPSARVSENLEAYSKLFSCLQVVRLRIQSCSIS